MKILAFGVAKEIVNGREVELPIAGGQSIAQLRNELNQRFPRLLQLSSYLIAVNDEYAEDEARFREGDEVAIIPPVSGG